MCQKLIFTQTEETDLETASNSSSESSLMGELREEYNAELDAIDCDFLPSPLELIEYLLEKCGKSNSSLDILFDMQDFTGKTSLLYVITEFRDRSYFNLQGTTEQIMHQFITDKLTANNNAEH